MPAPAWLTCWLDQKPVRACPRDSSQICRSVTPPRPVPTTDPFPEGDRAAMPMVAEVVDAVIGGDTHRTRTRWRWRPRAASRSPRSWSATTTPDSRTRWPGSPTRARTSSRGGAGRHPQLRDRAGPGVDPGRVDRGRGGTTETRNPPRPRQVRPDRRASGRAGGTAHARRPAAHPPRGRGPRSATDPAGRPRRADRHLHPADQPAPRPAAHRRRHRPGHLGRPRHPRLARRSSAAAAPAPTPANRPPAAPKPVGSPSRSATPTAT